MRWPARRRKVDPVYEPDPDWGRASGALPKGDVCDVGVDSDDNVYLFARDPGKFATISKGLEAARAEKDAAEERWLALAEQVEG